MFLPGYLFLGLAGNPIQLAVLPACNEFKHAASLMTAYSAVYAASSLIFTVFEVIILRPELMCCFTMRLLPIAQSIYKKTGYGHKPICLVYAGIILVSFTVGFILIPTKYATMLA